MKKMQEAERGKEIVQNKQNGEKVWSGCKQTMADWIEGEDCRTPWHYTDDGYQRDGVVNEEKRGHLNELLNGIFDGEKVEIPSMNISRLWKKARGAQ